MAELFKKGLLQFEETGGLSEELCLKTLLGNLLKCKDVVSRAKIRYFRKKLLFMGVILNYQLNH